jgi:hypothetical protein
LQGGPRPTDGPRVARFVGADTVQLWEPSHAWRGEYPPAAVHPAHRERTAAMVPGVAHRPRAAGSITGYRDENIVAPSGFGLWILFQALPFQCRVTVTTWWPPLTSVEPTAHALFTEFAHTPCNTS